MNSIQKIILPKGSTKNIVKNLYFTEVEGRSEVVDSKVEMYEGSRLSFNSYFNSFYESYWLEHTNVDIVTLQIQVKGSGKILVYRDSQTHGCYEIASIDFDHANAKNIKIEINAKGLLPDVGRVFFDVISNEEPRVQSDSQKTHVSSKKNVVLSECGFFINKFTHKKLSVGICTFNRENFLYDNLYRLVEYKKEFSAIEKVFVVNQGNELLNPKLLSLLEKERDFITVISQGNMGGTGGFTRSLYESIKTNQTDFHLMMDDDVIIDPSVIETAYNFACNAKKPIAVGGQMLDLLRPNILHEYGGRVDKNGYIKPQLNGINLAHIPELSRFNEPHSIDFNAWWFCMLPIAEVKQINLPAPIFIRGDDQEYGYRLKEQGTETVGLPGVALWHEPFYVKVGGWQTYYDFRNRMILSSSYDSLKEESANRLFLRITNLLLCHDYQRVYLVLQAIKDFSKGSQLFLDESSEEIHARISALAKKHAPISVDNVNFLPLLDEHAKPKLVKMERRKLFANQIAKLSVMDCSKRPVKHLFDRHIRPENIDCSPYIKTNGIHSYYYLYQPSRRTFVKLLREIVEARISYTTAVSSKKWQNLDELKQQEYWKNIFA